MKMKHRKIDFERDKEYILERHCRINHECECPWKRKMSYEDYRSEWFYLHNQIKSFTDYFKETMDDYRTIAVIIEDSSGKTIGYMWVPFNCDEESGSPLQIFKISISKKNTEMLA